MAPLTIGNSSDQVTALDALRGETLQQHYDVNKLRVYHARFNNDTGSVIAADINIALISIPQGLILPQSRVICEDLGTGTLLDVGFDEYKKNDGTLVASNPDFLIDGADVSTAAINSEFHTIGTAVVTNQGYVLEGQALLVCQPKVSTWATNAEINIYIYHVSGQ